MFNLVEPNYTNMKANELRVGNWCINTFDVRNHKIIQLNLDDFQVMNNFVKSGQPIPYKPIPTDKDWLLKFGFTNIADRCAQISSLDLFILDGMVHFYANKENGYQDVTMWWVENEEPSQNYIRLTQVHQVQNLYFDLTGGKEFELMIEHVQFEIIKEFPNMNEEVGDVITLPDDNWIYADGKYAESDYFKDYPEYFKLV